MLEQINEEMHLEEEWFEQAQKQTVETLPKFISHIMCDYKHDYGTVCHAVAACALAGMWAADNTEQGGITGFQAGFVMWDIVKQTCYTGNKCGLKITNYDDILYPQYEEKFDRKISKRIWESLQNEAESRLKERANAVHPDVKQHWQSIVDGHVPFGFKVEDE